MTTTSNVNYLLGQAEREFGQKQTSGKSELDKEDFLTLLVAQLSHQDPLNPMDDKEFTAQLAEFSSLEQLTGINDGIESLSNSQGRQEMLGAVGFIGKEIRAGGSGLSLTDGEASTLYYNLSETAASVFVNIYDPNNNLVRTVDLGGRQAGQHEFQWDGLDWSGADLPDGVYTIGMAAEGLEGQAILLQTEVSGEVAGVQNFGSTNLLRLKDGRMVDFNNVYEVVNPTATTEDQE